MHRNTTLVAALAALAAPAIAQPTMALLPRGYIATDVSANGTVLVGNTVGDGAYETFRWTQETGIVRLGRATVPVIGTGAGTPDVSYDGTRISATILSSDGFATQGIWDLQTGWTETMPPPPADAQSMDGSYGSAWGLSGDGTTLTGFYWNTLGRAQGCTWSDKTGMVALDQVAGRSVRVNASNIRGDVVVGWEERADGAWRPTAWRSGVKFTLADLDVPSQAYGVNGSGTIVVGDTVDVTQATRSAAIWRWNGTSYQMQLLGWLPGTALTSGGANLDAISDDGRIAVGTNMYTWYPGGSVDGFVWTPGSGMIKDTKFLTSLGLNAPLGMDIRGFNTISPDGCTIVGYGLLTTGEYQTFVITIPKDWKFHVPRRTN